MKCDCCGKAYDIMYRTIDTRVYCLDCSKRTPLCCYGKPVVPSEWFRVAMSEKALKSLEERGHTRTFEDGCNSLLVKRVREPNNKPDRNTVPRTVRPKYQAKTALNFKRSINWRKK